MSAWLLVAGPAGVPLETILVVLVALVIGVFLARVALSLFWKVLVVATLLVGVVYTTGVLL